MSIPIDSITSPPIAQFDGDVFIEIYCDKNFTASSGRGVIRGDLNDGNYCVRELCTNVTNVIGIPLLSIEPTEDGIDDQTAKYSAFLRQADQQPVPYLLKFTIPPLYQGEISKSWPQLRLHKAGVKPRPDNNTYTITQTEQAIALRAGQFLKANVATYGLARFPIAPADSGDPIAVPDNDPRVNFVVNLKAPPFNAVGNGTADDTAAVELFLAQTGIGIVPAGSYKISSNLPSPALAALIGAGFEKSIFVPTAAVTSFMTLLTNTRLVSDFCVDGSATTNAVGLTFGLHPNEWGGQAFRVRSKNFTGSSGVGFRIADAEKGSFYGLLGDGSYVNMLIQRSGVSGSGGLPTTLDFYSCQLVNAITNGLLVKGCELVKFFGLVAESNGAAGVRIAPTADDALDLQLLSSYFEDNWHGNGSQSSNYSLEVDTSVGGRTARVAVRDSFFHAGAEKSVKFTGMGTVGNLLDNVQVYNTAGSIFADTGTSVTMNNFPANLLADYSTIVTGSGIIINGVQPGTWTAWVPSYSTQSSMTFGTVTTTLARYKVIGKTCFVELSFVGTVGGTPSAFIVVSLPSGIVPAANTAVFTPSIRMDAARANSVVQTGGTDGLYFYYDAATSGVYTAGSGRGGAVSMAFEIN